MAQFGQDTEADLQLLDVKIKQARNEYEQYFLGTRPREPQVLRGEVQTFACQIRFCPIHAEWNEWTNWGTCSEECGDGEQTRTRDRKVPWTRTKSHKLVECVRDPDTARHTFQINM